MRPLQIRWTKGNCGQPWNELCDSISDFNSDNPAPELPGYPQQLLTDSAAWSWSLLMDEGADVHACPAVDEHGLHYAMRDHYHPAETPTHLIPSERPPRPDEENFKAPPST